MSEPSQKRSRGEDERELRETFDRARVESRRAYLEKREEDIAKLRRRQFEAEEEMFGSTGELLSREERERMITERRLFEEALKIKEQRGQETSDVYMMPDVYDEDEERRNRKTGQELRTELLTNNRYREGPKNRMSDQEQLEGKLIQQGKFRLGGAEQVEEVDHYQLILDNPVEFVEGEVHGGTEEDLDRI